MSALGCEIAAQHHRHEPDVFAPPDEARDSDFWRACVEQQDGVVLVCEIDSSVVGLITARLSVASGIPFLMPAAICRVGTVCVSHRHRRLGIGTRLLRGIEEWAREQRALEVRLEVRTFNEAAIRFYAAVGYDAQSLNLRRRLAAPEHFSS